MPKLPKFKTIVKKSSLDDVAFTVLKKGRIRKFGEWRGVQGYRFDKLLFDRESVTNIRKKE